MNDSCRYLTLSDLILNELGHALRVICPPASRSDSSSPAEDQPENPLDESQKSLSVGLMRINHSGEIAAQALYRGQAIVSKDKNLRQMLLQAAEEEQAHLVWCKQRLLELDGKVSHLASLWYVGSFLIGTSAGLIGDEWSLGFVEETEVQVSAHLGDHLRRLPKADSRSRAILTRMRADEARHAEVARKAGARKLPESVRAAMTACADIMRSLSFRV